MTRSRLPRFALPGVVLGIALLSGTAYGQVSIAWEKTLLYAQPNGVSAAPDGVYMVGVAYGVLPGQTCSGAACAMFLRKYDLNGNELWTRQFGASIRDWASGVCAAVDGVYVVGQTWGALPGQSYLGEADAFLRKYDLNGNELWTRQFGSSKWDAAGSVTVSPDGVYVAGTFNEDLTQYSAFLHKYDFNGNQLWAREWGSSDQGSFVSSTADGVYMVGTTGDTGSVQAFARRYDLNGNELWARQFGSSIEDEPAGVSAASDGVYVAWGISVSKMDLSGKWLWTRQFGTYGVELANGMSASADGIFVIAGQVYQYDPNGNLLAALPVTSPSTPLLFGVSAITGRVYVAGPVVNANQVSPQGFLAMLAVTPKPLSHVLPLPSVEFSGSFSVQWFGADNGGPGIQDYTIYVSDNGGPFNPWLTQTTATQSTFTGASLHTYGFYSIARDLAGNVESFKSAAEATTYVDATKPLSHVTSLPGTASSPNFLVQWSGTDVGGPGIRNYNIYVSDNGIAFTLWQANTTAAQAWYVGRLGHTYGFFSQAIDTAGSQENMKSAAEATTQVPAYMAQDVNGDGQINCLDLNMVKAALGTHDSAPNWNPADVNRDGVVDVRDVASVSQKLVPGTTCN